MGVYDTYCPRLDEPGKYNVQIKTNATGKTYQIGSVSPLPEGLHFGYEGAVYISGCIVRAVIPYDQMYDKWGGDMGFMIQQLVEGSNPVKQAVDKLGTIEPKTSMPPWITVEAAEKIVEEMEGFPMKPYWMVHRRGKQSGPATQVQHSAAAAFKEAERLAKKEMDSFTILQAVGRVKPVDVIVEVEAVYQGNMDDIPDALPKKPCPCGCGNKLDFHLFK